MRNSLFPTLAVLVLVALVVLVPEREAPAEGDAAPLPAAETAGADVARSLAELRPLELYRPPAWARASGDEDPVARHLDRLAWGPHGAQLASRDALQGHTGALAPRILDRLRVLGESDPIQTSLLLGTLGPREAARPEMLAELQERALSESGLVSKAALRALRQVPGPESLGVALILRHSDDEQVRAVARALLAEAVERGNPEARVHVLEELRARPGAADQDYVAALGEAPYDAETVEVLRQVQEQAPPSVRYAALGALTALGDAEAIAELEDQIASRDHVARFNALFIAASAGRPIAQSSWDDIVARNLRQETLILFSLLDRTIRLGSAEAPRAFELLLAVAGNPSHQAQVEALDLLVEHGDGWAVERTRQELLTERGLYLGQTLQRVLRAPPGVRAELTDVAEQRLQDPELGAVEQALLLELLAQERPERAAEPVVQGLLEQRFDIREGLLPALVALGEHGLRALEDDLHSDRGAGLYVLAAAHLRTPAALPELERLAGDTERHSALRRFALDTIARLAGGDREGALRRVASASGDEALRDRAMLLFWNYL